MPIWNKGKQEHWKDTPPPPGWDPKWPAIFVIADKAVWGDDGKGNLDFALDTRRHGLCNGPEIARFLQHKTNSERPTLWALVPVGHLDYSHLEGGGVTQVAALTEGQRELPSGKPILKVLPGGLE